MKMNPMIAPNHIMSPSQMMANDLCRVSPTCSMQSDLNMARPTYSLKRDIDKVGSYTPRLTTLNPLAKTVHPEPKFVIPRPIVFPEFKPPEVVIPKQSGLDYMFNVAAINLKVEEEKRSEALSHLF